jgi:hypothetical protein
MATQRGLSFVQIGLRHIIYQTALLPQAAIPPLPSLPRANPPPTCASLNKRDAMHTRIEFNKVTFF